jgi:hypothetical protein
MKKIILCIGSLILCTSLLATLTTPVVTGPPNNSPSNTPNVTISWNPVTNADKYDYKFGVGSNYASVSTQSISGTTTLGNANLEFGKEYFFQLMAIKTTAIVDSSMWSDTLKFTIVNTVNLNSPLINAFNVPIRPQFVWTNIMGVTSYSGEISLLPDMSIVQAIPNVTTSPNDQTGSYLLGVDLKYGTKYYWRVKAMNSSPTPNSGWSPIYSFTTIHDLATPVLVSPVLDTFNIPIVGVNLTWAAVSGATSYDVQLDVTSSFSAPKSFDTAAVTVPSGNLVPGKIYFWRVRAKNTSGVSPWCASRSFAAEMTVAPTLSSPVDSLIDVPVTGTNLTWASVSGASNYRVQWDDNPNFSSPISVDTAALLVPTDNLIASTVYYWRVKAMNSLGGSSPWSAVRSLATIMNLPPILSSPSNAATNIPVVGTALTWASVSGAARYQLQWSDNANFATPLVVLDTISLSAATGILSPSSTYYWRVKAKNSLGGGSPWSSTFSLKTASDAGLEEVLDRAIFSIFPNPSSGEFTLVTDGKVNIIEVYDLLGTKINQVHPTSEAVIIDLAGQPSGVYFVRVHCQDKMITKKIEIFK